MHTLVPDSYKIPRVLKTEVFVLRPLVISDNELDYLAVTNSMSYRGGVDEGVKSLTKEQNVENLARHQDEFKKRIAFAYTVMSLDGKTCLGCVYINPPSRGDYDAEVWMWVTVEAYKRGIDSLLYEAVRKWLSKKWPFRSIVYPGRSISWDEWDGMEGT